MITSSPSPDISGPRKHKLSTKASTNGDPLKVKWKKTISTANKDATATAALTKKKTAATAVLSVMAAKALTTKQASEKLPEKGTQRHTTIEDVDDADELVDITMNPPQNTNSLNLEAENGSDNESDSNHAPEIIIINDNDEKTEVVDGTHLDTDEESDETQISRNFFFLYLTKLIMTH